MKTNTEEDRGNAQRKTEEADELRPPERKIVNREAAFRCPDAWNAITSRVIGCAMEVHSVLGPGLLERLYEDAFDYELKKAGLRVSRQHPVVIAYKDIQLSGQRLDLVVEDLVVVELKAIDRFRMYTLRRLSVTCDPANTHWAFSSTSMCPTSGRASTVA